MGKKPGQPGGGRKKPERIDETVEQKLDQCPDCGHPLSEKNIFDFWDHAVPDIIPAHVKVTCYRHYRYRCPRCHKVQNSPAQGDEIPRAKLGPRVLLAAALYKYHFAMPYNKIAGMLEQTCGLKTTASALAQGVKRLSEHFEGEIEALQAAIRASPALNIDETGWRINGDNHYLWVFTDKFHTLYRIAKSRGSKIPLQTLGEEFAGVVISDFFSAYSPLDCTKQKCHVHLLRTLHEIGEKNKSDEFQWLNKKIRRLLDDSVRLKNNRQRLDPADFQRKLKRLVERAVELGDMDFQDCDSATLAGRMKKYAGELFTFVDREAVERDNNRAEQGIRPNVVIRKISGGNRAASGASAHENLMSLIVTCRKMGKDWFDYGKAALKNYRDDVKEPLIVKA